MRGQSSHQPEWWMMRRAFFEAMHEGRASVRRGDVRQAILAMLREQPRHGYDLMRELEQRTGGRWRPSAGSIYPTLQQLEDEGLIKGNEQEGRRVYTLTESGKKEAERSRPGSHAWLAGHGPSDEPKDMRRTAMQLVAAAVQVRRVGSAAAQEEARRILVESRRRMYQLLAEDEIAAGGKSTTRAGKAGKEESDA
jgi:DNA-binding PadR family transcriptional regulator